MKVSELHLYPLKSARGIPLEEADMTLAGIPGDRRMMITDPEGMFITQRDLPALARLTVVAEEHGVRIAMASALLNVAAPDPRRRLDVTVWKSPVSAALGEDKTNATLSAWLGRDVRLVFFDDLSRRTASAEWTGDGTPVAFADGYQVLITTTASLHALNADMQAHGEGAVGMERFRPNIVLDTDEAWAEDGWVSIEVGGIAFDLVKPCARCIMTAQDQQTGSREAASPLPAMGRIRMSADRRVPGPLFGWNAVPRSTGRIRIGDEARVTAYREIRWPIKRR
ncbi:MOSC domain-containing protein [Pseudorhizobium endolithicum]|uniref:MOSC domain-containing protein n=1 Tax=Pseudorhizobium endolithicum TaxID=1191678 RepID=A0ABN7JRA8_9HYPH|nr:MOSC domain-containing protein [Pseudorhizobium endolithicum]CAD7044040.1 MOSC domain-containing protein [Pseudorhizobium endolithicum]